MARENFLWGAPPCGAGVAQANAIFRYLPRWRVLVICRDDQEAILAAGDRGSSRKIAEERGWLRLLAPEAGKGRCGRGGGSQCRLRATERPSLKPMRAPLARVAGIVDISRAYVQTSFKRPSRYAVEEALHSQSRGVRAGSRATIIGCPTQIISTDQTGPSGPRTTP
jgi:hypothetical protein